MIYLSARFPTWNMEYIKNLSHYTEKGFLKKHKKSRKLNVELDIIKLVIDKGLNSLMGYKVDYEKMFVIDFCIKSYKFAVFLLTKQKSLYDGENEKRVSLALSDLIKEILTLEGWTVLVIDFAEFQSQGAMKETWLCDLVSKHIQIAIAKNSVPSKNESSESSNTVEKEIQHSSSKNFNGKKLGQESNDDSHF